MLLVTGIFGAAPVGAAPAAQAETGPGRPPVSAIKVNGDLAQVGAVAAPGRARADGECQFDSPVHVRTTAPGQGTTKWVVLRVDQQCQLVVQAKWTGALTQGPVTVVEPLQRLLPTLQSTQSTAPGVLSSGTKTSQQYVYMYGGGGTADKLTSIEGRITFSWDGTNASISSGSESCGASDPPGGHRWVVDSCGLQYQDGGPRDVVWRTSRGSYHCDPPGIFPCNISEPDGYYHNLYASEDGHGDTGLSHCDFWAEGYIVLGPGRDIWQGCS